MIGSLSDLKERIGLKGNDEFDGVLYSLLASAEAEAGRYCNREFVKGAYTEWFYDVEDEVFVKAVPISSVSGVQVDGEAVDVSGLFVERDVGRIYPISGKVVMVVYEGGFEVVPVDVKLAIEMLAGAMFLESMGQINVVESQEIVYKPSYLRKRAFEILDRYRLGASG